MQAPPLNRRIRAFLSTHSLPVALVCGVFIGLVLPELGVWLDELPIRVQMMCVSDCLLKCLWKLIACTHLKMFIIFLIQGMNLKTDEMMQAMSAWRPAALGLVSILFVTPLFAVPCVHLGLRPIEFNTGFALMMAMPTTISSGIMITREAQGNVPLSILLCVVSNVASVATVPALLPTLVLQSKGDHIHIDSVTLLLDLMSSLLLPLVIGKVTRDRIQAVADFSSRHSSLLRLSSSIAMSMLPMIQIASTAVVHSIRFVDQIAGDVATSSWSTARISCRTDCATTILLRHLDAQIVGVHVLAEGARCGCRCDGIPASRGGRDRHPRFQ